MNCRDLRNHPFEWILGVAFIVMIALAPKQLHAQTTVPNTIEFRAPAISLTADGWVATGPLRITPLKSDTHWVLKATSAAQSNNTLKLSDVVLEFGERRLKATTLTINLDTATAEGIDVELTSSVEGSTRVLKLQGQRMVLTQNEIRLDGAILEPCCDASDPDAPQGLTLVAAQARLLIQENLLDLSTSAGLASALKRDGALEADDVVLKIGALPVAWLPGLTFPLDGRRSGLLPPELGWLGAGEGLHVGVGGFVTLGSAWDITPKAWWRSSGRMGGELRLRHVDSDHIGGEHSGDLAFSGLTDGDQHTLGLRGIGALTTDGLPDLRYDARFTSRSSAVEQLRLPLAERLGTPTRSVLVIGDAGAWSAFEAQASMLQLPQVREGLWSRQAWSLAAPELAFSLRGNPVGPLLVAVGLQFAYIEPTKTSTFLTEALQTPSNRLTFEAGFDFPLLRSRFAALHLLGALEQIHDIFEGTSTPPEGETARTITQTRQRTVAWVGTELTTRVIGRLGSVRHTIRPGFRLLYAPVRHSLEDDRVPYASSALDPDLPRVAAQATLAQQLGAVSLDIGALKLDAISPALRLETTPNPPPTPRSLSRVGAELRLNAGPFYTRTDAISEIEGSATGLHEAAIATGATWSHGGLFDVGLAYFGQGARLTQAPWRLEHQRLPGLHPTSRLSSLTGATAHLQWPLPGLRALRLHTQLTVPIEGDGFGPQETEIVGGITVGEVAGCIDIELQAARYAVPKAFDLFLTARLGAF